MNARGRAAWTPRAVLTLAALLAILAVPGKAEAHALLVSSTPPPGARLGTAPGLVVLRFSEPLVPKLSVAVVTDPTAHRFSGQSSGTQIVVFLTTNAPGPYTAMWTSVSAEDGHTVRGSFGFTVVAPSAPGSKGAVSGSSGSPIALGLFRTVQYAALLLAVGILLIARLARRTPELSWVQVRRLLPWVLGVALLAGIIVVSAEASAASNTSSFRGLGRYLAAGLPGRGRIVLLTAEAFALLASLSSVAVWPFLFGALVGMALSGHGASVRPAWWGVTVDAGHLVSAGLWAGGIMALAALRPPGGFRGEEGRRLLNRFSPVAVTAFLGTVALGIVQGLQDVGSWHGLFATTYGRVLVVKAGLVAAMVPLSMLAWRRRVAPRVEGVIAVFVIGAAALLASYPLPKSSLAQVRANAPQVSAASPSPSSDGTRVTSALPAPGDLTLGDHAGQILVGLTVRPAKPGPNRLLVYLLPLQGSATGIPVKVAVNGRQSPVRVCGPDCRVSMASLDGGEHVTVAAGGSTGGSTTFELPRLPAPDGTALLQKAQQRMHALSTYRLDEVLNSGLASVHSTYAFEAPDRMRSVVSEAGNVSQVVYIGDTRYLQEQPGAPWQVQPGGVSIPVPSFIWDYFKPFLDPRIIGRASVEGVSTTVVSFSGGGPSGLAIWFRLWVDDQGLVRQARMRAIGHFMDHRYFDFDAPFTISAPTG